VQTRLTFAGLIILATLVGTGCGDSLTPDHSATTPNGMHPSFATMGGVATSITLDQAEAAVNIGIGWTNGGTHVGKEFDQNPQLGDAIVATFVWQGTTNTITSVTDHLEDGTPVGNTYTFVDYVTANGWSMATYVATNVGNFPYPSPSPDKNLAVHAIFSDAITNAGEIITAYRGVSPVTAVALGAHHAATGSDSTTTLADPGAIPIDAGALAYAVTMSDGVVDFAGPGGFGMITAVWNTVNKAAAAYSVTSAAGTVDPQWTWSFQAPSDWFAGVVALNPQTATHVGFRVQPSSTMLPGATIKPAVQVVVLDDQGNTVPGFTGSVTVALAHDGSLFQNARLSGTLVETVTNGVATFSDLSIDEPGMGYTLRADVTSLTSGTSNAFNVMVP